MRRGLAKHCRKEYCRLNFCCARSGGCVGLAKQYGYPMRKKHVCFPVVLLRILIFRAALLLLGDASHFVMSLGTIDKPEDMLTTSESCRSARRPLRARRALKRGRRVPSSQLLTHHTHCERATHRWANISRHILHILTVPHPPAQKLQ